MAKCHSVSSKELVSFNFMAAVTVHNDFGAQESKICHCIHFSQGLPYCRQIPHRLSHQGSPPKMIHRWKISIQQHAQNLLLLGKCKLKQQRDTVLHCKDDYNPKLTKVIAGEDAAQNKLSVIAGRHGNDITSSEDSLVVSDKVESSGKSSNVAGEKPATSITVMGHADGVCPGHGV